METEIIHYIQAARQHGFSDQEIKKNLRDSGWKTEVIEESFTHILALEGQLQNQVPPPSNAHPVEVKPVFVDTRIDTHSVEASQKPIQPEILSDSQVITKKSFPWKAGVLGAIIVFTVAGSAYGYYAFIVNSPEKIWNKFTSNTKNSISKSDFSFIYSDPGLKNPPSNSSFLSYQNIKLSVSGSLYYNITDPKNVESKADTQYTFSAGNNSFSTSFQYLFKNNVLYLNSGDNPLFSQMDAALSPDKKIQWIKIDLGLLQSMQSSDTTEVANKLQEIFNPRFLKELQKTWDDAAIVKIQKYIGKEKINAVSTLHFQNTLDKQSLQTTVNSILDKIATKFKEAGQPITNDDLSNAKFAVNQIINRIEIKQFETWIGLSDAQLYRIKFVSNAPSILSAIQEANSAMNDSNTISADAKRLADMRQMASAVELYYNDYNGYPDTSGNGEPSADLYPAYIGILPKAPTPATGACNDYYNTYWYQPKGESHLENGKKVYSSYEYTFCLGRATAGYKAGIARLSPTGIQDAITCSGSMQNCPANNTATTLNEPSRNNIKAILDKIDFSGEVNVQSDFSDYNKKQEVTPPTDSIDILKGLVEARALSRDAKRFADMRQLAVALELYFNDKSDYPQLLQEAVPNYIGILPTPPAPADGACSDADNTYSYSKTKPGQYELNFCLGSNTGGYKAGKHKVTPAGIQ